MKYQLNVGSVYKFMFKSIIENIDDIYKLRNIMTIDDIIEDNIDLFKDNFANIGVTQDDYNNEILPNLQNNCIFFKLQRMNNVGNNTNNIFYIPEFLVKYQPIYNVQPYLRLGLAVNLGVFNDANRLNSIKNEINDMLKSKLGIDQSAILFGTNEVWLTDEEYNEIEQDRQDKINNTSSIYKDKIELEKTVLNLQNIINDYEQLIIAFQ